MDREPFDRSQSYGASAPGHVKTRVVCEVEHSVTHDETWSAGASSGSATGSPHVVALAFREAAP